MTRLLFIQAKNRGFFYLALGTCLLAFLWMLVGVYVQLKGATSSCTDWPRCFGFFNPTLQIQFAKTHFSLLNWVTLYHYLSATLLVGMISLTLMATKLWQESSIRPLLLCFGLLLLAASDISLLLQTATHPNTPFFQLSHTLIAFSLVSLLWWLSRMTHPNTVDTIIQPKRQIRSWTWLSLLFTCQLVLSLSIQLSYLDTLCAHATTCTTTLGSLLHLSLPHSNHYVVFNMLLSQQALDVFTVCSILYLALFSVTLLSNQQLNSLGVLLLILLFAKIALANLMPTGASGLSSLYQTAITSCLLMMIISLLTSIYRKPHQYWSRYA